MNKTGLAMCCCLLAVFTLAGLPCGDEAVAAARLSSTVDVSTLDENERAGLLHMREEEKLARDVYLALYTKWEKRIFINIIASEQQHMDAVKLLLERYQVPDPVAGLEVGVFATPAFRDLYNRLVEAGIASLAAAYQAGVTIEELDIGDLKALIQATDNPDIKKVYTNLLKASQRHLSAFESQLDRL